MSDVACQALLLAGSVPAWHREAACRDADPDLFFPTRGETRSISVAKAICRSCPVRAECLEDALDRHEKFGIWGGTSERDRRKLRRQRRDRAA